MINKVVRRASMGMIVRSHPPVSDGFVQSMYRYQVDAPGLGSRQTCAPMRVVDFEREFNEKYEGIFKYGGPVPVVPYASPISFIQINSIGPVLRLGFKFQGNIVWMKVSLLLILVDLSMSMYSSTCLIDCMIRFRQGLHLESCCPR